MCSCAGLQRSTLVFCKLFFRCCFTRFGYYFLHSMIHLVCKFSFLKSPVQVVSTRHFYKDTFENSRFVKVVKVYRCLITVKDKIRYCGFNCIISLSIISMINTTMLYRLMVYLYSGKSYDSILRLWNRLI